MSFLSNESGPGIIEYALIIILVFIILFTILTLLWPALVNFYQETLQNLPG